MVNCQKILFKRYAVSPSVIEKAMNVFNLVAILENVLHLCNYLDYVLHLYELTRGNHVIQSFFRHFTHTSLDCK